MGGDKRPVVMREREAIQDRVIPSQTLPAGAVCTHLSVDVSSASRVSLDVKTSGLVRIYVQAARGLAAGENDNNLTWHDVSNQEVDSRQAQIEVPRFDHRLRILAWNIDTSTITVDAYINQQV